MGASSVVTRSCTRCGVDADAEDRYCSRCGADLAAVAGPPPPVGAPAPAPPGVPRPIAPDLGRGAVPVLPTAIGRRASPLGWLGVVLGAGAFLAASLGVVWGWGPAGLLPGGAGTPAAHAAARFDSVLYDGETIVEGDPFTIDVEAVNAADTVSDPLWMVIDWVPGALPATPGTQGRVVACEPAGCASRADPERSVSVVRWPALAARERRVLRVTVAVTGLEPETTFWYRVRTGSGPSEDELAGGYTWDLDLEVQ